MVFHSRHTGFPVIMEDGQVVQKLGDSEHPAMVGDSVTTHIQMNSLDSRIIKARVASDNKLEEPTVSQGLLSSKAFFILFLWYFFSAITLFLNKYIVVMLKADTVLLGEYLRHFATKLCFNYGLVIIVLQSLHI